MVASLRRWLAGRDTTERRYLAVGGAVLAVYALQAAKGFWFLIPMDPFSGLLFLGVALVSLFYLLRAVYLVLCCLNGKPALLRSRLGCLGGLLLVILAGQVANPYFQGARLRFWLQGGEAAYLRFAAEARAKNPPELPPLPPEPTLAQYQERERQEKEQYAAFRKSLDTSLLRHRPTQWSNVGVDNGVINLWSGSGLTGSWGIEIHDQPEIPAPNSIEATNENPYLPRQRPLSPRVWYWESR